MAVTEILTSAQMRALERAAIESGSVTGLALMERAGAEVVAALLARFPELAGGGHRALVLCGPGNNGGDGYVVARMLAKAGWTVTVQAWDGPARLPPDAAAMRAAWGALGPVQPLGAPVGEAPALVVDALFGIGLARPLPEAVTQALAALAARTPRPRVVAVDLPSGLGADDGRDWGAGLAADLTVTFHAAKLGHYLGAGPGLCGALAVADIGLPVVAVPDAVRAVVPDAGLLRKRQGHKFDHGHALVLAGGVGRGGAARLAARAALRVGAGLVTLAPPPAALIENAARLDAVMLAPVRDGAGLAALLADARIRSVCLGPGLGLTARAAGLVAAALADPARRALVLDADALTLIARDAGLAAGVHGGCVLTPHEGEFLRLAPDLAGLGSAVDRARALAGRMGAVVLLKGAATAIAAPGGACALNTALYDREVPWLATAGAGDVLAGLIAGLLARGLDPFAAATQAAWLHAEAARMAGPGLIAEDLPEALPGVFRALGL